MTSKKNDAGLLIKPLFANEKVKLSQIKVLRLFEQYSNVQLLY